MNSLQLAIKDLNLSETAVMNALQGEVGLVSDLCVTVADVYYKDCPAATNWVLDNRDRFKISPARV